MMPKRHKGVPERKFVQLDIPGMELVETNDSQYADGYEWQALVTDFDLPAADILPLYRERGDCEKPLEHIRETGRRRLAPRGGHVQTAAAILQCPRFPPRKAGCATFNCVFQAQ